MSIKYALESAVPGTAVWLDQDMRDKTEDGMMAGACMQGAAHTRLGTVCAMLAHSQRAGPATAAAANHGGACRPAGVESSRYFGLFLTQFLFSRPFCQKEARRALACCKPIILLRETDLRHGALRALERVAVLCVACYNQDQPNTRTAAIPPAREAKYGGPGDPFPTHCEDHKVQLPEAAKRPLVLTNPVAPEAASHRLTLGDAANLCLIYDQARACPGLSSGIGPECWICAQPPGRHGSACAHAARGRGNRGAPLGAPAPAHKPG